MPVDPENHVVAWPLIIISVIFISAMEPKLEELKGKIRHLQQGKYLPELQRLHSVSVWACSFTSSKIHQLPQSFSSKWVCAHLYSVYNTLYLCIFLYMRNWFYSVLFHTQICFILLFYFQLFYFSFYVLCRLWMYEPVLPKQIPSTCRCTWPLKWILIPVLLKLFHLVLFSFSPSSCFSIQLIVI